MQYSTVAGTVNKNMDIDFLDISFLFFIRYSSILCKRVKEPPFRFSSAGRLFLYLITDYNTVHRYGLSL